jgi:hypothetical protein
MTPYSQGEIKGKYRVNKEKEGKELQISTKT